AFLRGAKDHGRREPGRIAPRGLQQGRPRVAPDPRARDVGDPPPARVERQAPAQAAPASRPIELDRSMTQLAAEPRGAPHQPALEVTSAMRPTIVSSGSRSPARVGALASTITSPSRVTRPTAVVVPPTSTPTVTP